MPMTSFIIGRVVEPELRQVNRQNGEQPMVLTLGILSGRSCLTFDIFEDSKVFEKASSFSDGDLVVAVVGVSEDGDGSGRKPRNYLNRIGSCPDDLREQLMSCVK